MKKINNLNHILIMVHPETNHKSILSFLEIINRSDEIKLIIFVLMWFPYDRSKEILEKFPTDFATKTLNKINQFEQKVKKHFISHQSCKLTFIKIKMNPVTEVLEIASKNDVDLLIIERENENETQRTIIEKIIRKAPCSVLIIPTAGYSKIKKILVPLDFSEYSRLAVEMAIDLSKTIKTKEIQYLHVYHIPIGISHSGMGYHEISQAIMDIAKNNCDNFLTEIGIIDQDKNTFYELSNDPVSSIQNFAMEQEVDLVVVGNRGKGHALLMGSVGEGLVRTMNLPLWIVKKKSRSLSFVKLLLSKFKH